MGVNLGSRHIKKLEQNARECINSQEEHLCEGPAFEQRSIARISYYVILTPSRLFLMNYTGILIIKNLRDIPLSEILSCKVKKGRRVSLFGILFWIVLWPISLLTTKRLFLELAQGKTIVLVFNDKRFRQIPEQICDYLSTVTGGGAT